MTNRPSRADLMAFIREYTEKIKWLEQHINEKLPLYVEKIERLETGKREAEDALKMTSGYFEHERTRADQAEAARDSAMARWAIVLEALDHWSIRAREAEATLQGWRTYYMADATGHMLRCAKVNGKWVCAEGCAAAARDQMARALEQIERWDGFPATGQTWEDGSPMSYSASYGSIGERDYMRGIARAALLTLHPEQCTPNPEALS